MGAGLATLLVRPNLRAFAGPSSGKRVVVVVMQRGAVDGLAMIPPHGDPELHKLRPTVAAKTPIDLDGHFGLHAGLAPLVPHWKAKRLAIVPAVGLVGATRSHFEAQDLLEQGGVASDSGWANRWLAKRDHIGDATAIAVGQTLPRALAGTSPALVVERTGEIGIARKAQPERREQLLEAFGDLYASGTDPFSITARRALASAANVEAALAKQPAPAEVKGPVGQALMTAARLIEADLGAELIVVDTGGWDTHVNEAGRLDRELGQLGTAIGAFADALGDRMADVTLVTISEFGRTVKENGTGGTDHGTATMSLVLGGAVDGGKVCGTFPGLADDQRFEGRDLAITTDSRDLLAEVLAVDEPGLPRRGSAAGGQRGVIDDATIFPNHERKKLGLFR
ncbi:MAG TPA: DUF1501 domain-containing protein [Kofleriaceae bacterium]